MVDVLAAVIGGCPVLCTRLSVFRRERTRYAPYAAAVAARFGDGLDAGWARPVPVVTAGRTGELGR
jgi:hypothetical protein